MAETNKILAILDNYLHDNPDEIAKEIAAEFRRRRIEKNLTREQVARRPTGQEWSTDTHWR